jgi:hypothetical protein
MVTYVTWRSCARINAPDPTYSAAVTLFFLTGDLTQLLSHSYQTFLHWWPGNRRMGIKIAWRLHCCFLACAVLLSSHQTVCQSIVCCAQVAWHPPGGTWDGDVHKMYFMPGGDVLGAAKRDFSHGVVLLPFFHPFSSAQVTWHPPGGTWNGDKHWGAAE